VRARRAPAPLADLRLIELEASHQEPPCSKSAQKNRILFDYTMITARLGT
jgi:hypothetical protein